MDFMRVIDQTVREIKREVNLKVLKIPEIEQKVLDATSDEPWGPHGSALSEIASATKISSECQMILHVLWTRLSDTGANWRHVYKALAVMEYLIANGSDKALDNILNRSHRIAAISDFQYVEPNGKDVGINVRKKVETILALLADKEKIEEVRNKASANRDKYFGLSSTGVTYKSSSSSIVGSGFHDNDRYGSLGGGTDDFMKDKYSEKEHFEGTKSKHTKRGHNKSQERSAKETEESKSKKGARHQERSQDTLSSSSLKPLSKPRSTASSSSLPPLPTEDDFDDFDPRGTSSTSASASINQVNLFGGNLVDLMDAPTTVSEGKTCVNSGSSQDVDLFADAVFTSGPSHSEKAVQQTENVVGLFTTQASNTSAIPNVDLFVAPDPQLPSETKSPNSESMNAGKFDPFGAISLNNFEKPDEFGAFASHPNPPPESSNNSAGICLANQEQTSSSSPSPATKKETFQVKSGIWADCLSRGIIDLNITAPKKVSLSEIGIVPGLGDGLAEGPLPTTHMGRSMGLGPRMGMPSYASNSSDGNSFFSSLGQQQFGSFK